MNIDTNSMALPTLAQTMAQEAAAALRAITDEAKAANMQRIAELSEGLDEAHSAEHIRGMVAATMGHLSGTASAASRNDAEHWQGWALGVADRVQRGVSAVI